jgi:hypothetical protein
LRTFAALCGGRFSGEDGVFTDVSTDTRSLRSGDIYLALRGPRFDGNEFLEADALARARTSGSRSAELIVRLQMAIVRFHFAKNSDALACLRVAEPFLDGVVSTWHVPMFHQYFALSIWASADRTHDAAAEASLDALRALASDGLENFGHRVALVSAARALCRAELAEASEWIARAIEGADRGGWLGDLVVAHELAAEIARARGEDPTAEIENATEVARRWGIAAPVIDFDA